MFYKIIVRPLFFLLNPEFAHRLVVKTLKFAFLIPGIRFVCSKFYSISDKRLNRDVFGLKFTNPVGLAAGFDKNGDYFNEMSAFGFSFIEVGTVTPEPQPGNPKPRLFRLIPDNAMVNRMGFNNKGVNYVKLNLARKRSPNLIIGGNIGKNTLTPNKNAVEDYLTAFSAIYPYVDYIAVNVSCPNVKNLRDLQDTDNLDILLNAITMERQRFAPLIKPILLKVSPDLTDEQLISTVKVAEEHGIDGYIATNTSTLRNNLITSEVKIKSIGDGGLSGKPLSKRSTEVIRLIYSLTKGAKPIIGVGGIHSPADAIEKIKAGATLIQVYTGFIYEGPAIVKRINKSLLISNLE